MEKKAVFLDAGYTLFYPWPSIGEIYARKASEYGVSASGEDIEKRFREVWGDYNKGDGEKAITRDEKEFWKMIVGRVFEGYDGFTDFETFFEDLHSSFAGSGHWRMYDDVRETLEALKNQGMVLAVVSNWDSRLRSIISDMGVEEFFSGIFISAEVGISKPDPGIFELAIKEMGLKPREIIHVGDSYEDDVLGAREAGIEPVWLRRGKNDLKEGVRQAASLKDLIINQEV